VLERDAGLALVVDSPRPTALTLQLAVGVILTVVTIWIIPLLAEVFGWRWVFAFLAPGPALGVLAMLRLKSLPEAARLAGGLG
jgi:hypothetical protein